MLTSSRLITVEWGDCDPQGIVFNPRFFVFYDACTAGLFEAAGIDLYGMQKAGEIAGIPMADTRSSFFAPVLFGDTIEILSSISEFRRSSFDISHRVMRGGEKVAEGNETRVWTLNAPERPGGMKASPLPADFVARLSGAPT